MLICPKCKQEGLDERTFHTLSANGFTSIMCRMCDAPIQPATWWYSNHPLPTDENELNAMLKSMTVREAYQVHLYLEDIAKG